MHLRARMQIYMLQQGAICTSLRLERQPTRHGAQHTLGYLAVTGWALLLDQQ